MTYEEIVAYARKKIADVDVSEYKGHLAVQVNITGEGSGAFYVELNDGKAAVEPYEYFDRDAILIASADVFNALVDGKKDAVAAYLSGELRVEGNLDRAQEFGEVLKKRKKKAVKKTPAKATAKAAKPAAKTTAKAAKSPAKATAKTPAKAPVKAAEPAKKVAEATKKAAVATAKKVVAKKSAETK
ncbi:MAG: SCP2 sterol-binding domain-containing protein [Lachnospiraceae bacterium]